MRSRIETGVADADMTEEQSDWGASEFSQTISRQFELYRKTKNPQALLDATILHPYYPAARMILISSPFPMPGIDLVRFLEEYLRGFPDLETALRDAIYDAFSDPVRDQYETDQVLGGTGVPEVQSFPWSEDPNPVVTGCVGSDIVTPAIAEACLRRTAAAYRYWLHHAIPSNLAGFGHEFGNATFQLACLNSYLGYQASVRS